MTADGLNVKALESKPVLDVVCEYYLELYLDTGGNIDVLTAIKDVYGLTPYRLYNAILTLNFISMAVRGNANNPA